MIYEGQPGLGRVTEPTQPARVASLAGGHRRIGSIKRSRGCRAPSELGECEGSPGHAWDERPVAEAIPPVPEPLPRLHFQGRCRSPPVSCHGRCFLPSPPQLPECVHFLDGLPGSCGQEGGYPQRQLPLRRGPGMLHDPPH